MNITICWFISSFEFFRSFSTLTWLNNKNKFKYRHQFRQQMIETQKKSSVSSVFIDEYTEEVVEYNPPEIQKINQTR